MKRWLNLPLLVLALGVAPAPLVVGAVRDQFGNPIAGATVSLAGAQTTTDAFGTFALSAAPFNALTISCTYCQTTRVAVSFNQPVVAIVQRFEALVSNAPTERDLSSLPYAHVESALALRPFVVLEDSRSTVPGPRLSLYGASREGGALIDDGFSNYDVVAGISTFATIPSFATAQADVRRASDAPRYGDLSTGGIYVVDTHPRSGKTAAALLGSEGGFSFATDDVALSTDSTGIDNRDRISALLRAPLGEGALSAGFLTAQDRLTPSSAGNTNQYFSGLRLRYDRNGAQTQYAEATIDRGAYVAHPFSPGSSITGEWSDGDVRAGMETNTQIELFSDLDARTSTGDYTAPGADLHIGGKIGQMHLDAGASSQGSNYEWTAGLGAFTFDYSGGSTGVSQPLRGNILVPDASGSYRFAPQWSISLSAGRSFRLPVLLEAYTYPATSNALSFDRYWSIVQSLNYTDLRRLSVSLTELNATGSDLDAGAIRAAGGAVAWQAAPMLALRAWIMHFDDQAAPNEIFRRFGAAPRPATVGSVWMTYDNAAGLRADLIYRSDLVNYFPDRHIDASLSGPLNVESAGNPVAPRWFVSTEQRHGARYFAVGIRLDSP